MRVSKMKIFLDNVREIDDNPDYLSDEDGEINNEMRPDTTDVDSSVLSVCFINCLNLYTVVLCAVILNVVICCFCFCLADTFCRHCFLCTKQH